MQEQSRREIGRRLKEARAAAEMSQEDVASDLSRSRQAVSSWESGRTLPNLLEFRDLAALYGVSSDSLLYGLENVAAAGREAIDRALMLSERRED